MRDAAGENAQRVQFAGAHALFHDGLLVTDIAEDEHGADDLALQVANGRGAGGDHALGAGARDEDALVGQVHDLACGEHL